MTTEKIFKKIAIAIIMASLASCSSEDEIASDLNLRAIDKISSNYVTQSSTQQFKNDISYTIGFIVGNSIHKDPNLQNLNLNKVKIIEGFNDAINNRAIQISKSTLKNNIQYLQYNLSKKINDERIKNFAYQKNKILRSNLSPRTNIKDPKVIVYDFFDYQCIFCSQISSDLKKVMKNNDNIQVVFVEFPIFGNRWEASQYAASVGIAIYKLYGSDAYIKYNNAIFESRKNEGKLEKKDVEQAIKDISADITKVKTVIKDSCIDDHIRNTIDIGFKKLNIQGTPFLVVAPANGNLNSSNTTIIDNYIKYQDIQAAIYNAQNTRH